MNDHTPTVVRGHRRDIQGLRAVAVLLVALSHAGIGFLGGGFVGVDVFFVLSGFLITGILVSGTLREGRVPFVSFYVRRAQRILPAAALTLLATSIGAYLLLNVVRAEAILRDTIAAAFFVANFRFADQGTDYFAQDQPPSAVQHYWSLAVEEQYYLIWPTLIAIVVAVVLWRRHRRHGGPASEADAKRVSRSLLAAVGLIGVASLAWSIHSTANDPTVAYFSTLTRAWELALGGAVALAAPRLVRLPARALLAGGWFGVAAIVAAAVAFSSSTPFPGYAALLPTVGTALVILAGLGTATAGRGVAVILTPAPMRYVGDRSYTFYLWHWPFLIIAEQRAGHDLSVGENMLLLAAAFAVSIVSYRLYENPIRRVRWKLPSYALYLWPASIAVVAIVALLLINRIELRETADRIASLPTAALASDPGAAAAQREADADAAEQAVQAAQSGQALPAVRAAVDAAMAKERIPTGLHPQVTKLLESQYKYPDGCTTPQGETRGRVCRLGNASAKRTIMTIGDSHMQMWMPPILAFAQRDGWAVLPVGKSGCTPQKWTGAQAVDECAGWYAWALTQIRAMRPDVLIVSGAYSGLGASGRADAVESFTALLEAAKPSVGTSVILADPPGQEREPVDCLLAGGATMDRCSSMPTDAQLTVADDMTATARIVGAKYFDTTSFFCDRDVCPMVVGKTVVYRDRGHLTQAYADELAAPFRVLLSRLIS